MGYRHTIRFTYDHDQRYDLAVIVVCFPHSVTAGRKVKVKAQPLCSAFTLRPAVTVREAETARDLTDTRIDTDNDPDRCSVALWSLESCHTDRSPATNDAGNQGKHRVTKRRAALSNPMFTLVTMLKVKKNKQYILTYRCLSSSAALCFSALLLYCLGAGKQSSDVTALLSGSQPVQEECRAQRWRTDSCSFYSGSDSPSLLTALCDVIVVKNPMLLYLRSYNSLAVRSGGCFPGTAMVTLAGGQRKSLSEIQLGDKILTTDETGQVTTTEVLLYLHKDQEKLATFVVIEAEGHPYRLRLTPHHLLFVSKNPPADFMPIYAHRVQVGEYVQIYVNGTQLVPSKVMNVSVQEEIGVFAPLTTHGTLLVDGILTSCYAIIEWHELAHSSFAPLRFLYNMFSIFPEFVDSDGIHWYCYFLYVLAKKILWWEMP
ncbi:unnamed protein product [Ranitomeya imitator]|uniref:Uncharacterized protein n=1 Tax=Ranitomeya imitator TaxID=111125 RepID=A0ABN9LYD2_9NEOB|nr:unnamed protein product [Ranitomeya imitator]